MSKAKIRSMQRGAQKRSSAPPIKMGDIYKKHPPRISNQDKPHLDFLKFGKPEQVAQIKTVVEAARKNGIGTASEISKLLNKLLIKTAIGENWTPRLAWFASSAIRKDDSNSRRHAKPQTTRSSGNGDANFRTKVDRMIRSRLEEIHEEFNASTPTLGDSLPELAALKKQLEGNQ